MSLGLGLSHAGNLAGEAGLAGAQDKGEGSPPTRLRRYGETAFAHLLAKAGGEKGIRTLGTVSRTHAFQACSFNHSDISPFEWNQ